MKSSTGLALALAVACAGAGCISETNYCATWIHQSWTTNKAWRSRKWMYEGIACESSFKAGFKAGYRFANCGGDSCQPPGPSHFWSAGGITEEDQRESQAWCDGFTHGALAAQQDGNAMVSALDAQTAQPPAGVPEVYYYSGLGASGSIGAPQGTGEFAQGQFAPGGYPAGQYSPGPFPPEPLSAGTAPFESGTMSSAPPWASNRSTEAAPADVAHPPAAPPAESMDRPNGNAPSPSPGYHGSAAFSGIGSLRSDGWSERQRRSSPRRRFGRSRSAGAGPRIGAQSISVSGEFADCSVAERHVRGRSLDAADPFDPEHSHAPVGIADHSRLTALC